MFHHSLVQWVRNALLVGEPSHLGQFGILTFRLQHILKVDLLAVCEIHEGYLVREPYAIPGLRIAGIAFSLLLHIYTQRIFLTLCLDHSDSLIIHKKQVVTFGISLHESLFNSRSTLRDISLCPVKFSS